MDRTYVCDLCGNELDGGEVSREIPGSKRPVVVIDTPRCSCQPGLPVEMRIVTREESAA